MVNKNYYWNQSASKVIPMRKLKENYIKQVDGVNLNDLKTKYAMIIITKWNKDYDGSGEVHYALKYMNGKYWMRMSGGFVDIMDEAGTYHEESSGKWHPITLKELDNYRLFDDDGEAFVFSDYDGGVVIHVVPYSAKGLHGYQSPAPRKRAASKKHSPAVKVNVRKMF